MHGDVRIVEVLMEERCRVARRPGGWVCFTARGNLRHGSGKVKIHIFTAGSQAMGDAAGTRRPTFVLYNELQVRRSTVVHIRTND